MFRELNRLLDTISKEGPRMQENHVLEEEFTRGQLASFKILELSDF